MVLVGSPQAAALARATPTLLSWECRRMSVNKERGLLALTEFGGENLVSLFQLSVCVPK